ncbi:plasmid pRiA4b ORF-3 family protein [Microbacterium bovistercoris]|uniref:Plasmid pRiA4b ORF-3 family protein n=1 Tax=Microbacterium bovistercoris TaxID=2293570 RepID=A0A371NSD7_9MICO|nr:plasmid pRiA4b ORF-3 family protein [Microbacterium bovistercoris]REJ05112.1 plasmid pRiA4b ORF-3 family protein [Microbacterium bovistercoris]
MTRYRLRATLVGSAPEIWRELEIDGSLRLADLHDALQLLFGWREMHLHQFTDADPDVPGGAGRRWESPYAPDAEDDALSEIEYRVEDVLRTMDALWYEYDFGDGWTVRTDVTGRHQSDPVFAPVVLLDGARRGPFEDSGGLRGYTEKLEIAADPRHPEHDEIVSWMRATVGPWAGTGPGAFDLVGMQSELNLRFTAESSGYAADDMSGIVKADRHRRAGDFNDASPLAVFLSQLPPPIRSELRRHLHATGILDPVDIAPEDAARIIRPFGWLMDAVGTGGLALTAAGWMPPATVLDGMTQLGWMKEWKGMGKGNREDVTPPILVLRETAQRIGLVRVAKGRLLLSAAAKKALGDPLQQLRLVAGGLYRKLGEAETDAAVLQLLSIADGTPKTRSWETVAFGMEMSGWASSTGCAFTERDIRHATFHADQVLMYVADEYWKRQSDRGTSDDVRLFARAALR